MGSPAGSASRVTHAPQSAPAARELAGVLRAGDELLVRCTSCEETTDGVVEPRG